MKTSSVTWVHTPRSVNYVDKRRQKTEYKDTLKLFIARGVKVVQSFSADFIEFALLVWNDKNIYYPVFVYKIHDMKWKEI